MVCGALRHGTSWACRHHGCQCPAAIAARRAEWQRANVKRRVPPDPVVAERAAGGVRIQMTRAERHAAIDLMERRRTSARVIAETLGVAERTVHRRRAARRECAA